MAPQRRAQIGRQHTGRLRRRCYQRSTALSPLRRPTHTQQVPCSGCHGDEKRAFEFPILALGLVKARKIARAWAEEVERKFDMACTVVEGEAGDMVAFTRAGVSDTLAVAADHFALHAPLGFLLGAFSRSIEAEITTNLDRLLSQRAKRNVGSKGRRGQAGHRRSA